MTVTTTTNRVTYSGTGSAGPFSYGFRVVDADHLEVTTASPSGGEATLVYPDDFTVSGIGNRSGGSITLATALPSGYTIAIRRVVPIEQQTDLRTLGTFTADSLEKALDKGIMIAQQISEVSDRAMTLPVTVDPDVVSAELPPPAANKVLIWNPSATALTTGTVDTSSIVVPGNGRTVSSATSFLANNAEYDVRDFGAVGNGSTDDAIALQACFTQAGQSAGSVVRIRQGQFKTTAALTVPANVRIQGDGGAVSEIVPVGLGDGDAITIAGDSVVIEDIGIRGSGSLAYAYGITLAGRDKCRILRCWISGANGGTGGAKLSGGGINPNACTNLTIEGNRFFSNGTTGPAEDGTYFTQLGKPHYADINVNRAAGALCTNLRIVDNDCLSTRVHFNILAFNVASSTISGNRCSGARTNTAEMASGYGVAIYRTTNLLYGSVKDNEISRNSIGPVEGIGIYYQSAVGGTIANNVLNGFATVQTDSVLAAGGITCSDAQSVAITGNRLKGGTMAGISLVSNGGLAVTIAGTVSCVAGAATFSTSQAGYLANGYVITVAGVPYTLSAFNGTTGGTLSGAPTFGASVWTAAVTDSSGRSITVTGNTIEDIASRAGVRLAGTLADVTIGSNTIRNCLGGVFGVSGGHFTAINISQNAISSVFSAPGIFVPDGLGLVLSKNVINGTNAAQPGIQLLDCIQSLVDANTILNASGDGIQVTATTPGTTSYNVTVSNNQAFDGSTAATDTYSGISINTSHVTVSGNQAGNTAASGFKYSVLLSANANQSIVTGNKSYGGVSGDMSILATTNVVTGGNMNAASAGGYGADNTLALSANPTAAVRLLMGSGAGLANGCISTQYGDGSICIASNAVPSYNADLWTQSAAGSESLLLRIKWGGDVEVYRAIAGKAAAVFATFWGSPVTSMVRTGGLKVNGAQVVSSRATGWAVQTTATSRADMGAAPTLATTYQTLAALIDDLASKGYIGA